MWNEGTKIAVWGCGVRGKKFYLRFRDYFRIECFIDSYDDRTFIMGLPIYRPEAYTGDARIVIAVEDNYEICMQCQGLGKKLYHDYLPYDMIGTSQIDYIKLWKLTGGENVEKILTSILQNKKIFLLIGNCQIENLGKLLMSSPVMSENYGYISIPPVHLLNKDAEMILNMSKFLFQKCELCVSQPVFSEQYPPILLIENIRKIMNKKGRLVIIPALYCDLYFPQTVHRKEMEYMQDVFGMLSFPYGDCIVNELVKSYTLHEVFEIVQMDNLFSERFLRWHFASYVKTMEERENLCTIKIHDYIINNFRDKMLFYSKNHPAKCVLVELARRIMNYLGYDDSYCEFVRIEEMDAWQEYIYPAVIKGYNIKWDKCLYRDWILDRECTREEYIHLYALSEVDKVWERQ